MQLPALYMLIDGCLYWVIYTTGFHFDLLLGYC